MFDDFIFQVESFIQKLSSLPEDVRKAAINKIQERLAPNIFDNCGLRPTSTQVISEAPSNVIMKKAKTRRGNAHGRCRALRGQQKAGNFMGMAYVRWRLLYTLYTLPPRTCFVLSWWPRATLFQCKMISKEWK
jgi:hypothetical protein